MSQTARFYDDWKAPSEDGRMLIWPEPARLLSDARDNATRLAGANHVMLQGIPLPAVRRRSREFIGHASADQPLVATGHQAELFHPGVWVKNALINTAARKLDGAAYHFSVDTDAPKHLHLRWPGGSHPITDDPGLMSAEWAGLLAPPTPHHLAFVAGDFGQAAGGWAFTPMVDSFISSLRKSLLEPRALPPALTNAMHAVDWELGLRHHALVLSPVWTSPAYLLFVHALLARADAFATAYNRALHHYRIENGVTTLTRPMPNLESATGVCEAPFWLDQLGRGSRTRAEVHWSLDGAWELRCNGDAFTFEASVDGWDAAASLVAWLRRHDLRLSPRALTLTLFFRMLLVDQFIHGIGGGRYDQVTDRLIADYFGIEPPRFSVTTATMYFPAAAGQRRINLRPLLQEGRRIRHGMLSRHKREAVARIAELPRGSRERRDLFFRMHARLASDSDGPDMRRWEGEFRAAQRQSAEQRVLFDRELFFAVQPKERLLDMIARYDQPFD